MIEVTDEMLKVARSMQSFELMIKRIIELHEQSKPKQEPYRYISENTGECVLPHELPEDLKISGRWKPLYDTPPTREPLSEDVIVDAYENSGYKQTLRPQDRFAVMAFARAIEQAHGIGVTK